MNQRPRKNTQNYTQFQPLQTQIASDFQVYQHLQVNCSSTNNQEQYAKLLNNLISNKRNTLKLLKKIKHNRILSQSDQRPKTAINTISSRICQQDRQLKFRFIDDCLCQQTEKSVYLQKQLIQTKKTLDLLKGDIGHLIKRSQSAQLLGSKVVKAKIVANDQLKKVSMALTKDKEQIKLRNQMQKKFSKKLKNISAHQSSSLLKTKQSYAKSVIRHERTYELLQKVRNEALKVQQNVKKSQQTKIINENIEKDRQLFYKIYKVIKHYNQNKGINMKLKQLQDELKRKLEQQLKQQINEENITKKAIIFINELKQQQIAINNYYSDCLKLRQQLKIKSQQLQNEIYKIIQHFKIQSLYKYHINSSDRQVFNKKLKHFIFLFKSQYKILQYLQQSQQHFHQNQSNNSQEKKNQTHMKCSLTSSHFKIYHEKRYLSNIDLHPYINQQNLHGKILSKQNYHQYISFLHKIYKFLTSNQYNIQQPYESQISLHNFYKQMNNNIKNWFNHLKSKFSQDFIKNIIIQKINKQQEDIKQIQQNSSRAQSLREFDDESLIKQPLNIISKQNIHIQKQHHIIKCKRTQLVEGIDTDYYKMLKSTLKMQKQNTRKNYQFLRTFKRTKFASRDALLQQKRYQSSFSIVAKVKNSQLQNARHSKFVSNFTISSPSLFRTSTAVSKKQLLKNKQNIVRKSKLSEKLKIALQYF